MPALAIALLAAALAGFSRGFAAFGTAMIYVPLLTLAYDARTAVVTLFLVDIVPGVPMLIKAAPDCDRRSMAWMALGAAALSPVGVALLVIADAARSQLALGLVLVAAVSLMAFRPGLRLRSTPLNGITAGAVSGFAGGLCGIFGPPAMIYLIGRGVDARRTRADTIVFLTGESYLLGATYLVYGLYSWWYLELALLLLPVYGLATWWGAHSFRGVGEATYRRVLLALLGLVSALLVVRAGLALAA